MQWGALNDLAEADLKTIQIRLSFNTFYKVLN